MKLILTKVKNLKKKFNKKINIYFQKIYYFNMIGIIKNIIFLSSFIFTFINTYDSSPYMPIQLNNYNYLIIKEDGIFVYNKDLHIEKKYIFENKNNFFNKKKKNIFYFNNLPDNNIFIFIENHLHIFNSDGELIKKIKVFENTTLRKYRILFPYLYKIKNSSIFYYYIVVFINLNKKIEIDIYEYNYSLNKNKLLFSDFFSLQNSDEINELSDEFCSKFILTKSKQNLLNIYIINNKNIINFSKIFFIDINNKKINEISDFQIIWNKTIIFNSENYEFLANYKEKYSNFIRKLEEKSTGEQTDGGNGESREGINEDKNEGESGGEGGAPQAGEGNGGESGEEGGEAQIGEGNGGESGGEGGGPQAGEGNGEESGEEGGEAQIGEGNEGESGGEGGGPKAGEGNGGNNKNFNFDFENGRTNMTKKEIRENRNEIMNNYEQGKSYKIEGDGFEIKVAPMNQKGERGGTSIDFLLCETKLREYYHLNESAILSVFQTQTESSNERSLTNKVQYVVYDENNTQLNLSVCENEPIRINYALRNNTSLDMTKLSHFSEIGIDILNSSHPFFNDICYTYSDGGSDVILKDRISEIYQNYSLCDSDCEYESFDPENLTVSCSCSVSNNSDSDDDDSSSNVKSIILNLFDDSTFGVVKCYKLVFKLSNKLKNIGFWVFSTIILGHIPLYIIFFMTGISPINKYIIEEMKKFHYFIGTTEPPKKKKKIKIDSMKMHVITTTENNEENEMTTDNRNNNLIKNSQKGSIQKFSAQHNNLIDQNYNKKNGLNEIISLDEKESKKSESQKKNKNSYFLIKIDANNINGDDKPEESNYTLNNYEYETAIVYENRSFWRILYIIFLAKDNILNTFILESPLESKPLRICLFIFTYASDLALNALFYFSDNISDKYHYSGKYLFWFTLFNNMIISVLSTLLSMILGIILSSMADSKSSLEKEFNKEEEKMRVNPNYVVGVERKSEIITSISKSLKCLKIKMILFIIVDFIILLFFYYFVTAFCSVYQGTQTSWITDAIVSFIISFPIEVAIALLITMVYKISIKYKIKWLYNISMIFA